MQRRKTTSSHVLQRGFTIVELLMVIVVLSILVAIAVDSVVGYQATARDRERESDITVISQAIERYYRTHAVAVGATYPDTTVDWDGLTDIINTPDAVRAPGDTGGNSIVMASSASAQTPTIVEYIYQPLNINGTLCTTAPCVKYKLYYKLETTGATIVQNSLRQQ